jgi:hypothetical protein
VELPEGKFLTGFQVSFAAVTVIILMVLPLQSCLNPFAPRLDNELGTIVCANLLSTDDVFCVFQNAYSFKDTTLYGTIIAPSFTFIYTDYDRGVDITWGRDDEMRSTFGLFQSAQSLFLTWNNEIASSGSDTVRSIVRGFNLTVALTPSDITRITGYANLTLTRASVSSPWHIVRWRDESNF